MSRFNKITSKIKKEEEIWIEDNNYTSILHTTHHATNQAINGQTI
jgi:hypothetical protein